MAPNVLSKKDMTPSRLFAVSDLHLGYRANREIADRIKPVGPDDWLLIAGDVSERVSDLEWVLRLLTSRFARVVWVPGNHDLWTHASDPVALRGEERYLHLVDVCRRAGVLTPEDPYEIFAGPAGPALIAPLFLLYDYTFLTPGTHSAAESLAYAYDTGIVCADEALLHPDPYPSRADWCKARVAATEQRLTACDPSVPLIMVNHYPLIREPTRVLRHPEFAQWCGTEGPRTGTFASTPPPSSTATCTSRAPPGTTGSGSRRFRWGTRANGRPGRPSAQSPARCCPGRPPRMRAPADDRAPAAAGSRGRRTVRRRAHRPVPRGRGGDRPRGGQAAP